MPSASSGRSLFDALPDELVVQVVEHLAADREIRTLCNLARTCQFFQIESEKHIYTRIDLLSTEDLRALIEAFARRPIRIEFVETLNIVYSFHNGIETTLEERKAFNACVSKMTALRHWHVESPFDNFKWNSEGGHEWVHEDMESFRAALEAASLRVDNGGFTRPDDVGLLRLEELTIHSHGASSDFWELDGFHCLFRHSTLRKLHASCFVLPADLPELDPYARSTALSELVFDECILTPKSLGRILKTPKALKHLVLGENVYNDRRSYFRMPKLTERPEETLEALTSVAHSLETLSHLDPMWKRPNSDMYKQRSVGGSGLRDFHHLTHLQMDPCSFLYQYLFSVVQAPPRLERLCFSHALVKYAEAHNEALLDLFDELPPFEPYSHLANLKVIDFIQCASLDTYMTRPEYIFRESPCRERHEYAYKYFKRGVRMRMILEASWKMGLMPPYLHGEQKPVSIRVYDSAQVGFLRHIVDDLPVIDLPGLQTIEYTITGYESGISHGDMLDTLKPLGAQAASTADKEPQETDQLNYYDIVSMKNEARRKIQEVRARMAAMDAPSEAGEENEIFIISDDDDDDDFDEMDEDGELDLWFDAEDAEMFAEEMGYIIESEMSDGDSEMDLTEDDLAGDYPFDGDAFMDAEDHIVNAGGNAAATTPTPDNVE